MKHSLFVIIISFLTLFHCGSSVKKVAEPEFDRELIGEEIQFGRKAAKFELWHEALFRWEKVVKADPENVQALNNLGVAYEAVGDYESARVSYEKALEIDESVTPLRNNYKRFLHFYKRHMRNRERLEKRAQKEKSELEHTHSKKDDAEEEPPAVEKEQPHKATLGVIEKIKGDLPKGSEGLPIEPNAVSEKEKAKETPPPKKPNPSEKEQ